MGGRGLDLSPRGARCTLLMQRVTLGKVLSSSPRPSRKQGVLTPLAVLATGDGSRVWKMRGRGREL